MGKRLKVCVIAGVVGLMFAALTSPALAGWNFLEGGFSPWWCGKQNVTFSGDKYRVTKASDDSLVGTGRYVARKARGKVIFETGPMKAYYWKLVKQSQYNWYFNMFKKSTNAYVGNCQRQNSIGY